VINDSLGHSAGDAVLVEVSRRFLACVRENDVVARLSGDEFAILLEDYADPDTPTLVAQRIIESMAAPIALPESSVQPSVSIGITLGGADTSGSEELLRSADTAMYRAKASGRNRFQYFEEGLELASKAQLALELDLRQALLRCEFEPHFQAIVDLDSGATGRLRGADALAPSAPRPARSGRVPARGRRQRHDRSDRLAGVRTRLSWPAKLGPEAGFVNLNVSPRHFGSDDFAERLVAMIEAQGIAPSRVHIELTEGTLLRNPERVRNALERLHARGVQTALDDFGTGYSSLSYLHQFPLQMLKIDRSFVTPLMQDGGGSGEAIVSAILAMAHSLDLEVVAEGIETESQRARLQQLGCQRGQGYLFARPQALEQVLAGLHATAG
jgi:diguanylate cyclase (GGDEF)-like protein